MRGLELRVPPLALALAFAVAMGLAALALPFATFATLALPGRVVGAGALLLAGVSVALAGVWAFRRQRTTVNPLAPERATSLVTSGIYRASRNPMYLGFLLALAGWAVFLANAVAALLLPCFVAWMNRWQIQPEERALAARFGPEFAAYAQRVRRWL